MRMEYIEQGWPDDRPKLRGPDKNIKKRSTPAAFLLRPVDPQLEKIVDGMKTAEVKVGNVSYVDVNAYVRQAKLDPQLAERTLDYAINCFHARPLRADEIQTLTASGIPKDEAVKYITFKKTIRHIKMDTSKSPVWAAVGEKGR